MSDGMTLSPVAPRPGDPIDTTKREKMVGREVTMLEMIERAHLLENQRFAAQQDLERALFERDEIHAKFIELQQHIVKLEAEARSIIEQRLTMNEWAIKAGRIDMMQGGPAVEYVAGEFFRFMDHHREAKNYVEATFLDKADPERKIVVTIQRAEGKTPHALREEAERRLRTVEAEALELIAEVGTLREENYEFEQIAALQRKREQPWIERWREEDPEKRANMLPDYGQIMGWIMDKAEAAEALVREVEAHRDQLEQNRVAEVRAISDLRKRLGAAPHETLVAWIERLHRGVAS